MRLGAAANPRLRTEELGGVVRDAMARVGVADLADRSVLDDPREALRLAADSAARTRSRCAPSLPRGRRP